MDVIRLAGPTAAPTLSVAELIGRILLAAALGGLVGFEREFRDQPAGFRTHILVSLGATLFTIAGAYGVSGFVGSAGTSFDPTRIAAQVVTGIGFLGAGAILRYGVTVRGLTTAAALWVTAAIGVAVGLGYYAGAVVTSVATVLSLFGLKQVEATVIPKMKRGRHNFVVELGSQLRLGDLASIVDAHGSRIVQMKLVSVTEGARKLFLTISVPPGIDVRSLAHEVSGLEGVSALEWE
jgi:putative Mg2+ transporter-C (MgtC) family protein